MSCPGSDTCLCDCHNGYQRPCSISGGCGLTTPTPGRPARRIDVDALEADIHDLTRTHGYLTRLQALLPEPTTGSGESTRHVKVIGSPAPWNDEAAGLLFEVHAGCRRHETRLRHDLGWSPIRRGTTATSTVDALRILPMLVLALKELPDADLAGAERAATDIERWARRSRQVLDDDPHADERPHTKAPGGLTCPHCGRRLILKWGWQHDPKAQQLWCLRCPSTTDGADLSWEPSQWLGILQGDSESSA